MLRKTSWMAVALIALVGCGEGEPVAEEVAPPAEGAEAINENPSAPDVDVPGTPTDEAGTDDPADEVDG